MQKPTRKNSHKERIFSLPQNKIDFDYQKNHQVKAQEQLDHAHESIAKTSKKGMPLTDQQVQVSLKLLPDWRLSNDCKTIHRDFIIEDFKAAIGLINRIAVIAQEERHHPNIHLTDYRRLRIELTTHDVGGLSKNDFIEASKINDVLVIPQYN